MGGLPVLGIEFCVVIGEFLELDEEVADVEFEAGEIVAEGEEALNELGDLLTGRFNMMKNSKRMEATAYGWRFGNALCSKLPINSVRNCRLLVPAAARSGG